MKVRNFSPLGPFILKTVGTVLILLYLVDVAVLLVTARFQDPQWLLAFTTQLVDRGFLPLLGLAALFTGFWLEEDSDPGAAAENSKGLKLSVLLLASALGLAFLVLLPLHVTTARAAVDTDLQRVAQRAKDAEAQLGSQVEQAKGQLDARLNFLDQAIKSGQLQGEQLAQAQQQQQQLKKLKADPKALDAQIAPTREQALSKLRKEREDAEAQIRDNALRSGMRTGLASLVLAIAYAMIGWTGLRRML